MSRVTYEKLNNQYLVECYLTALEQREELELQFIELLYREICSRDIHGLVPPPYTCG
jgi:hypothetical protein